MVRAIGVAWHDRLLFVTGCGWSDRLLLVIYFG